MNSQNEEKTTKPSITSLKKILYVVFMGFIPGMIAIYHIKWYHRDISIVKFINQWEIFILFLWMASMLYFFADIFLFLGWRIYPFHWFGIKYNIRTFKISGIILFIIDIIIFIVTFFKI